MTFFEVPGNLIDTAYIPAEGLFSHYSNLKKMKDELILHCLDHIQELENGMHTERIGSKSVSQEIEDYWQDIRHISETDSSDILAMERLERDYEIKVVNAHKSQEAA